MHGDPADVTLEPVDDERRPVVERLAQLERHDLSALGGWVPGGDGLFEVPRLGRFFEEPGHSAHLIRADGVLAGFALVRPFEDGAHFIHSFFVVRSLRRHGVGRAAATALLRSRPGPWAIAFLEEYAAAGAFWRTVAGDVAGDRWTEGGVRRRTRNRSSRGSRSTSPTSKPRTRGLVEHRRGCSTARDDEAGSPL